MLNNQMVDLNRFDPYPLSEECQSRRSVDLPKDQPGESSEDFRVKNQVPMEKTESAGIQNRLQIEETDGKTDVVLSFF